MTDDESYEGFIEDKTILDGVGIACHDLCFCCLHGACFRSAVENRLELDVTMKLLLTSAGMRAKSLIEQVTSHLSNPIHCLYIITASIPELDKTYLVRDRVVMEELGWKVEEMDLATVSRDALAEALNRNHLVYVQGGNTFYLMKWIRESGFDQLIHSWLEKGGVYIGVSAGSIVAGTDMGTASIAGGDTNDVGLMDFFGMGFIDRVIEVHYEPWMEEEIVQYEHAHQVEIERLTDDQAMVVDGECIQILSL